MILKRKELEIKIALLYFRMGKDNFDKQIKNLK